MRGLPDTHLLVDTDAGDNPHKQRLAIATITQHRAARTAVLSTQVLQAFVNVALRKLKLPPAQVHERLQIYRRFNTITTSADLIAGALEGF